MNKSCKNCKYENNHKKCREEVGACHHFSKWQPKEEKMRKPIFESEEELFNFMNETFGQNDKIEKGSNFWIHGLSIAKAHNYIRRSPVEEAEEMYNEKFQEHRQTFLEVKQNEAIQYQKEIIKQLEEQLGEK